MKNLNAEDAKVAEKEPLKEKARRSPGICAVNGVN